MVHDDIGEYPPGKHTIYWGDPCNHYARIVHECNLDVKGYAFAYDDVYCDRGDDQNGNIEAADPMILKVIV
jgi:hypothetical protein